MIKYILTFLFLSLVPAFSQQTVITQPQGVTTGNASGTIAVTNTFQSIWAADTSTRGRVGCVVVNYGASTMWIYFGPIAGATKAKSIQLGIGQAVYCNNSGTVVKDQVSITGTATEAYTAIIQ